MKLLEKFDQVLGLNVRDMKETILVLPKEVEFLIEERGKLRKEKQWEKADILRERIKERGYLIEDTPQGSRITKL